MHPHKALAIPFQADPPQKPQKTRARALRAAILAPFLAEGGDLIAGLDDGTDRVGAGAYECV
jgi:hypothetical protein